MKNYTFIIIALLSCNLYLFPQNIEWDRYYGGSSIDYMQTLLQTNDGGYIFVGSITANDEDVVFTANDGGNIWLVKTDESGSMQWEQNYGGSSSENVASIHQTSDGGYIMGGWTSSTDGNVGANNGASDFWVVKIDAVGNIEWEKNYGGSEYEQLNSLEITDDGGYILGGTSTSNDGDVGGNNGDEDFWVVKIDVLGNLEWEKNFGGTDRDELKALQQTSDGGFILGGNTRSNDGDIGENYGISDFWLIKTNSIGEIEWEKNFGGSNLEYLSSLQQTNDDGFILGGTSRLSDGDVTANNGSTDFWVVKIDGLGNLEWEKNFGGSDGEALYSIEQTNDNGFALCGHTRSSDGDVTTLHGYEDFWLVKTDIDGNLEWEKTFGHNDNLSSNFARAKQTADNGYIIGGSTMSNRAIDLWAIKITNDSDCMGIVDGPNTLDECGICDDNPNNDNATCTDCAGIINGTNALDHCEVCDDDPNNDNDTCTDCFGLIDGPNTLDACGVCDDDPSNDNLTCTGYAVISSNTPDLDFGAVELMDVASMSLNIQNLGEQPLSVSKFTFDDPAFYAEINEISLDELSETTVTIYFNPNEIKNYESELVLESNAGELNVNLFGEGVLETSINEILNTNLTISPNPSNGIFTINFDGLETQITEVKVYDVAGRCVLNQSFNLQNKIDLTANAAGIYYLYLQTINGIIVEKLIKK